MNQQIKVDISKVKTHTLKTFLINLEAAVPGNGDPSMSLPDYRPHMHGPHSLAHVGPNI